MSMTWTRDRFLLWAEDDSRMGWAGVGYEKKNKDELRGQKWKLGEVG
jgi:hypothetical protein